MEKICPKCNGTGQASGPSRGLLSSYKACDKCNGEGVLRPVVIEGAPATLSGKAQTSG